HAIHTFLYSSRANRAPHSFPTRRSSDLKYDAKVVRTAVGEINVAKKMQEAIAIIGGEGSGGVILPSVHMGRDSLVGVALCLGALDRKSTRLNSSHVSISYAVFCLKKKKR